MNQMNQMIKKTKFKEQIDKFMFTIYKNYILLLYYN